MKLWIARDKDGTLYVSEEKPQLYVDYFDTELGTFYSEIPSRLFPEVTFENSPQKVKMELIRDSKNKIKITEKILFYIKEKNKHITHFEIIPELNSEWNIDKITSYPNVCNGDQVIELNNEKGEGLRLPLNLID